MSKPPEHKVDGARRRSWKNTWVEAAFLFGHVKCEVLTEGTGGNNRFSG